MQTNIELPGLTPVYRQRGNGAGSWVAVAYWQRPDDGRMAQTAYSLTAHGAAMAVRLAITAWESGTGRPYPLTAPVAVRRFNRKLKLKGMAPKG